MPAIVDTGPLVAFFDRAERHWVTERVEELEAPLLVCEPVLTEAIYLLAHHSMAQNALFQLLQNGALSVAFQIEEHVGALSETWPSPAHAHSTGAAEIRFLDVVPPTPVWRFASPDRPS